MIKMIFLLIALTVNTYATARGLFGDQWQEDVVTSDGGHIRVNRSQRYGGPHDIGQQKPVNHQKLSFELPGTKESVTWENSESELGYVLYEPLLLDVINNVAYLVVTPKMCAAWRLVGKPNPPYIVFRYMDNKWESVAINVLPSNIAKSNLLVAAVPPDNLLHDKTISDKDINIMNGYIDDSYLKTIYRGKIKYECSEN